MKRIVLPFSLPVSALVLFLMAPAFVGSSQAGEDKGTIGIAMVCEDGRGNVYIIPKTAKGEARERAVRDYEDCVEDVLRRSKNGAVGVASMIGEARDGGIDLAELQEAVTVIRNKQDQLKAEGKTDYKKQSPDAGVTTKKRK